MRRIAPACLLSAMCFTSACQNAATPGGTTVTAPPVATAGTSAATQPTGKAAQQWTMPNLVGSNLQKAQDAIQALTGDAIFFTSSHDVSGRGRHQVLDADWKVCAQNVAPGTTITVGTKIDFGAVKLAENCP
jgi:hypothetical protein